MVLLGGGKCQLTETTVFRSGEDGYRTYRVPAIVTLPSGIVVAFAEGRVHDSKDHGNIHIVAKRSVDNGATWGPLEVIATNGDGVAGNPGPVIDRTDPAHPNGKLILLYNTSTVSEEEVKAGHGVREVWATASTNDGVTWQPPRNITVDVHRPKQARFNDAYAFEQDWRWYAVTPGHAIQLERGRAMGRLLVPANHSTADGQYHSHVFWSDDHGESWVLGGTVGPGTNEVQAVELSSGEVLLNMRNYRGGKPYMRAEAISADQGASWGEIRPVPRLIEPRCQASIVRLASTQANETDAIALANPAAKTRRNMTLKLSLDDGTTWPYQRTVYAGSSAYSDLTQLSDGSIGLLYERDSYARINFAHAQRQWITS
jgi:sialidase-1